MFGKRSTFVAVLLTAIVVGETAPRKNRKSSIPSWHRPCGENLEMITTSSVEDYDADLSEGLESISLQHQLTLNDYLASDYEFLYERARIGLQKHQYIPNWIPGEKDVRLIKKLKSASPRKIAKHLPKLHTDLQKFAVAFEELVHDETETKLHQTLKASQNLLLMTLCEVETTLKALPPHQVPTRIEGTIMSRVERDPVDDTRRLVRDWGVLLKYKDYLHAWRHVFNY